MRLTPGSAILLTMLIPGSAHVRLGKPMRGLLAFLSCVGLFFAGWMIVKDRIWYFALFEPFSLLKPLLDIAAIQLLPESPNLGCTIVAALMRVEATPDVLREIRAPVPLEHMGLFFTGASGVVAALWAVDAHWWAQERPTSAVSPPYAAMVSWLVPGAGHVMAGQRQKGLLVGGAVVAVFALGLLVSSGHGVDRPQLSAWWIGEVLFGGGTLFCSLVTAPMRYADLPDMFDLGVALCTVAGFMNLIVMIDAYTVAEGVAEGVAESEIKKGQEES